MARHPFSFDGGDEMCTMGAAWFVSYMWYEKKDRTHMNWTKVSTYSNRISVYNRTRSHHTYWLRQILHMNESNLDKNTIGLKGYKVIEMADKLLG